MCRLFGFRSAVRSGMHRSLVLARNSLSVQAQQHQHGWGIGYYEQDRPTLVHGINPASECGVFRETSHRLSSHTAIVHVRKATVGQICEENLHPFVHERWMFAHNGTIYGFEALKEWMRREAIPATTRGTTDSETLFHFLLGRMERASVGGDLEKIEGVLRRALEDIDNAAAKEGFAAPGMNFLLTNGRIFIAKRHRRDLWFATQKIACRDAQTCTEPDKVCLLRNRPSNKVNHLILASERIGDEDAWEEVPEDGMLILSEDFLLRGVDQSKRG